MTLPLTPYWSGFWSCAALCVILALLVLALAVKYAQERRDGRDE